MLTYGGKASQNSSRALEEAQEELEATMCRRAAPPYPRVDSWLTVWPVQTKVVWEVTLRW